MVRLAPLLANGVPIISEHSRDEYEASFPNGILWTSPEIMYSYAMQLIDNPDMAYDLGQVGKQEFAKMRLFQDNLRDALAKVYNT
jgi:predicted fused transcriptional regulator/phosphomethylpyrimidine kinase